MQAPQSAYCIPRSLHSSLRQLVCAQAAASRLTPSALRGRPSRSSWRQHAGFGSLRQARGGQPQARSGAPQQQQEGGSTGSAAAKRAGGALEEAVHNAIDRLAGGSAAGRGAVRRRPPASRLPLPRPAAYHRCRLPAQVIPALAGDATEQTPPDLPSYLFKERIVYLVSHKKGRRQQSRSWGAPRAIRRCCRGLSLAAGARVLMLHTAAHMHTG